MNCITRRAVMTGAAALLATPALAGLPLPEVKTDNISQLIRESLEVDFRDGMFELVSDFRTPTTKMVLMTLQHRGLIGLWVITDLKVNSDHEAGLTVYYRKKEANRFSTIDATFHWYDINFKIHNIELMT